MAEIQQNTPETSVKDVILNIVNSTQGIKAVELAIKTMGIIGPMLFDHDKYLQAMYHLVNDGEIVELEYILPQMEYRAKSLYFPKGTKFFIYGNAKITI